MRHYLTAAVGAAILFHEGRLGAVGIFQPRVCYDAREPNIETLLAETTKTFTALKDEVKALAQQALTETKNLGTAHAETKANADKALANLNTVSASLETLKTSVANQEAATVDLARKLAQRGGGNGESAGLTAGAVVAASDALKNFKKAGARGVMNVAVERGQFRNAITSVTPGGGGLSWSERDPTVIEKPRRRLTVRDLLPQGPTTASSIDFIRQTVRTNNAAPVTEGGTKPESDYKWEKDTTAVITIAHIAKASRQIMDDVPRLQAIIDSEMRYGLAYAEESQLLLGDGTGENLDGLIPNATAYVAPISISGAQQIDKLRLAILQVALADYAADGIVLHPGDWAAIELLKDGEDRYLWASPRNGLAGPGMWGLPVVDTPAMVATDFLVGAFQMAARIWDRMDAEVLISSEDGDNFKQNMLTIRAEERLALEVWRPASLVYGSFN